MANELPTNETIKKKKTMALTGSNTDDQITHIESRRTKRLMIDSIYDDAVGHFFRS